MVSESVIDLYLPIVGKMGRDRLGKFVQLC